MVFSFPVFHDCWRSNSRVCTTPETKAPPVSWMLHQADNITISGLKMCKIIHAELELKLKVVNGLSRSFRETSANAINVPFRRCRVIVSASLYCDVSLVAGYLWYACFDGHIWNNTTASQEVTGLPHNSSFQSYLAKCAQRIMPIETPSFLDDFIQTRNQGQEMLCRVCRHPHQNMPS